MRGLTRRMWVWLIVENRVLMLAGIVSAIAAVGGLVALLYQYPAGVHVAYFVTILIVSSTFMEQHSRVQYLTESLRRARERTAVVYGDTQEAVLLANAAGLSGVRLPQEVVCDPDFVSDTAYTKRVAELLLKKVHELNQEIQEGVADE